MTNAEIITKLLEPKSKPVWYRQCIVTNKFFEIDNKEARKRVSENLPILYGIIEKGKFIGINCDVDDGVSYVSI